MSDWSVHVTAELKSNGEAPQPPADELFAGIHEALVRNGYADPKIQLLVESDGMRIEVWLDARGVALDAVAGVVMPDLLGVLTAHGLDAEVYELLIRPLAVFGGHE